MDVVRTGRRGWMARARVALAVAAASWWAGLAVPLDAQELPTSERFAVAEVTNPAVPDNELEFSIGLSRLDEPRKEGEFATLGDATLALRFHHVGKEMIDLLLDGPGSAAASLTAVLDVELLHDDERPIERPGFVIGTTKGSDVASLLSGAVVQRLAPGEWAQRSVPFKQLIGVGQLDLAPGLYRIRVTYRGIPAELRTPAGDWTSLQKHAPSAWHGAAKSQQLRFRIIGPGEPVTWSEPQHGLRVATFVAPSGGRAFVGETIVPRFLVENVSTSPIRFWRPAAASQEDDVGLRRADGEETQCGKSYFTGWHTTFEWTLAPGHRVWVDAATLRLASDGWTAGNTAGIASAALGRCTVAYTLCLSDGGRVDPNAPYNVLDLHAPPFTLEVLDRAAK